MPCRCCASVNPCNGMEDPEDQKINDLLKEAAKLVNTKYSCKTYDPQYVHYEWTKAFEHHLIGCPDRNKRRNLSN